MEDRRVRSLIELTSPEGSVFNLKWRGSSRKYSKRLDRYAYAGINGETSRDFGNTSHVFSMELIFGGNDFDLEAERFIQSTGETGPWEVIHPTRGFKKLHLMDVDEPDNPVANSNGLEITTTWTDYIDLLTLKTPAELLLEAGFTLNDFNLAQSERFAQTFDFDSDLSKHAKVAATSKSLLDKIKGALAKAGGVDIAIPGVSEVSDLNNAIQYSMLASQRGLQNMINSGIIEPLALVARIQETVQLPGMLLRDTKSRMKYALGLALDIFGIDTGTGGDAIVAATKEVGLTAAFGAAGSALLPIKGVSTRAELTEVLEAFGELLNAITNELDNEAEKVSSGKEDTVQFYTPLGPDVFNKLQEFNALVKDYGIQAAFDMRQEKSITIPYDMSVIEAVVTYYGSMDYYDEFVSVNGLNGSSFYYLSAGDVVKVYV